MSRGNWNARWISRLSIRHKVMLVAVSTSLLSLVMSAGLIVFAEYVRASKDLVNSMSALTRVVSFNAGAAVAFRDRAVAEDLLAGLSMIPDILKAEIFLENGDSFVEYQQTTMEHGSEHTFEDETSIDWFLFRWHRLDWILNSSESKRSSIDISTPISFESVRQGVLVIRADASSVREHVLFTFKVVLGSSAAALLIAFFVSRGLQRSVSQPIKQLADAFRDISSSQDYSRRVVLSEAGEIGELAERFNAMIEAIELRDHELHKVVLELRKATQAKSAFLANMSHEIRTPLHGILGTTALLLDSSSDRKNEKYYRTIDVSAKNLLAIINDILDLSSIEAGKLPLESHTFFIADLIRHIVDIFEPVAEKKGIQLAASVDHDIPSELKGDPRRVIQVLTNLVGNAIKFTECGTVGLTLSLQPPQDNTTRIRFSVQDTGIGIDEKSRDRVFGYFTQADESISRSHGGSGLGLAISKAIVEALGGEIGVTSEIGVGSEFWFLIPFEPVGELGVPRTTSQPKPAPGSVSREDSSAVFEKKQYRSRILLADDSEINRFIMVETLKNYGIETVTAQDGREAVIKAATACFDMIILDIQMPKIDGMEAAIQIRKQLNASAQPAIIAFSASAMDGDKERFLDAGMDDYLSKPMQQEELEEILERWLTD